MGLFLDGDGHRFRGGSATRNGKGREDMSGIYIHGMEMPKAGAYICELGVLDENTAVLTVCTPIDKSQISYKLVPVPPHGRLIDADALMERFSYSPGDTREDMIWIRAARRIIIEATTIIPADKEEEG